MAQSSEANTSKPRHESEKNSDKLPEWIMARNGIKFVINDKGMEAEKLFLQYPNSLVMYAGYAFTLMMVGNFTLNKYFKE